MRTTACHSEDQLLMLNFICLVFSLPRLIIASKLTNACMHAHIHADRQTGTEISLRERDLLDVTPSSSMTKKLSKE